MRIVFSTVVRHAPIAAGGWARVAEWPSGRLLAERPVVPTDPSVIDPNPRGNSRGGRGVVVAGKAVLVANYHTLEVCDRNLQVMGTFSHGNFAGIHEIMRRGERLFVASTAVNAAAEVPLEAVLGAAAAAGMPPAPAAVRFWWPTEEPAVCERLGVPATNYPHKQADNRLRYLDLNNRGHAGHLHLNAVDADGEQVYALLNKPGAILRLNGPGSMEVVLRHPLLEGAHNLEFVGPGRAWVVGTRSGLLLECDLVGGMVRPLIDLAATPFAREVARGGGEPQTWPWLPWLQREAAPTAAEAAARPLFWRGLAVDADWIFVGTSPAAILGFDRLSFAYQGVVRFGANVREIVHGIAITA
ncbi:MAG: hypothetical protein WED27_04830 [Pirellulales bacterium]